MSDEALHFSVTFVPQTNGRDEGKDLIGRAKVAIAKKVRELLLAVVLAAPERCIDTRKHISCFPEGGRGIELVGMRVDAVGLGDEEDLEELPFGSVIDGPEVIAHAIPDLKIFDHRQTCDLTTKKHPKRDEPNGYKSADDHEAVLRCWGYAPRFLR